MRHKHVCDLCMLQDREYEESLRRDREKDAERQRLDEQLVRA